MKCLLKSLFFQIFISAVVGAVIYVSVYGIKILNPQYIDWILNRSNDLVQHFIGWEFFRVSEWSFPPCLFNTLSYPLNASVTYTDSIPIMAVFFKIFSPILPKNFQYWGIWGLLCFILQSVTGMLIVRKFSAKNLWGNINAVLCGTLLALVPYLFVGLYWHSSLIAHWVLLLCFIPIIYYKDLNKFQKILLYSLIGLLSVSIHPYFMISCGIIMFFGNLYLYIKNKDKNILLNFFAYILSVVITVYLVGFFNCRYINTYPNLLIDTFNLNGFFNPISPFSSIIHVLPLSNGHQIIGYGYMGVGILFLLLISAIISFIPKLPAIKKDKLLIFIASFAFLTSLFLALSPRITFNENVIFEYHLPKFLFNLWSTFRGTGRLIYAGFYILIIFSFYLLNKKINVKLLTIILTFAIAIQLYDSKNLYIKINKNYNKFQKYESFIDVYFWKKLVENNNVKNIFLDEDLHFNGEFKKKFEGKTEKFQGQSVYKGFIAADHQYDLAQFAYEKNIIMNNFYFARDLKDTEKIFRERLKNPQRTDLFIFFADDFDKEAVKTSKLQYFYLYECMLLGSLKELNGIENIRISKQKLIK